MLIQSNVSNKIDNRKIKQREKNPKIIHEHDDVIETIKIITKESIGRTIFFWCLSILCHAYLLFD